MNPGRIFVLIILLVGVVGTLVNGTDVYVRLLYLGALLLIVAWLLTAISLHGVSVERRARSHRAAVGDVFEENFEISNNSRLTKFWLEVYNQTNMPYAAGSRVLTLLRKQQKRLYPARTWLTQRGEYVLGQTTITSGDPFGIFRTTKQFEARRRLIVFPMLFQVRDFLSPPGLLPGGKAIKRKSIDITPHAAGVREYVSGDPLKRIHWPTSLRRDQLMVKEFEQDPQAEVWLFLDTHKSVHASKPDDQDNSPPIDDLFLLHRKKMKLPPSTVEYSVSITASLAHYFLEQRRSVGLVMATKNSYKVIPAERSERQEPKILESLAFIQAESTVVLPSLVTAQMGQLPQGSSAIIVTPTAWPELLLAAESLQRRNIRPLVVLLMAQTFGSRRSNESLAVSLAERNIPVCRVFCDADLSEVLSSFTADTFSQEPAWRPPVLSHLT
ncbi:MAG TPA: DUF58 domain-containing protein [Anaerolineales bacterium]|nr:DUF58 domain-containing protein [Anaerolineales bacterium]